MTTDLEDIIEALAHRAEDAAPRHQLGAVLAEARQPAAAIDPGLVRRMPPSLPGAASGSVPHHEPGFVELAAARTRRPRALARSAVAAAIVVLVVAGVVATRGGRSGSPAGGSPVVDASVPPVPALSWTMPHVTLAADSITIDYLGQTFTPPADATAESILLSRTEEMARLVWTQNGIRIAWELSFTMRDGEWWVDRMAVLDDRTNAEGNPGMTAVHSDQDSQRSALGSPLTGVLDVSSTEAGTSARVRVTGMSLLGFRDRGSDGNAVPVETLPPPVLMAAPPLPDDVSPTGMYVTMEQWMAVLLAEDAFTRECMAGAGFDYASIPDAALIQTMGQFQITVGLSVTGRVAAAATGYHTDDAGILNGGAEGVRDNLPVDERAAFDDAIPGCARHGAEAIGDASDSGPMRAWGVVGDIRQQAYGDPKVIAALDAWGRCVFDAVGERAANPNDLARMYAFADGDPGTGTASEHEKAAAVADFDCQQQVGWETVWFTAVVERERAAMGDRAGEYDQWVRDYQAMVTRAQRVLDERGIVVPSLD